MVNQTTMLASETEEISNLKQFIIDKRVKKISKIFLLTLEIHYVIHKREPKSNLRFIGSTSDLAIVVRLQ